jgi:hypothetical protein
MRLKSAQAGRLLLRPRGLFQNISIACVGADPCVGPSYPLYGIGGVRGKGQRLLAPIPQPSQLPIISLVPTQLTIKVSGKCRASWVRALNPVQWPARMTSGASSFKPWMVSLMR